MLGAFIGVSFSAGCSSVYEVKVDAASCSTGISNGLTSFRIEDRSAVPDAQPLRVAEIAGHLKTALSAQGLYAAPVSRSADLVVEISYGVGPPRVEQRVEQELVFGRPVSAGDRWGAPPEGVTREIMGYTPVVSARVLRSKHLSIRVRENRSRDPSSPPEDIWRVEVSMETEGSDLRGHLPVLAAVAMEHLGRATDGPAELQVRSDGAPVQFIQRGL